MVFPESKIHAGTARIEPAPQPVEVRSAPRERALPLDYRRFTGKLCRGWVHITFDPAPEFLDHPEDVADWPGAEKIVDRVSRQIYRLRLKVGGKEMSCYSYYLADTSFPRIFRSTYAFRVLKQSRRLLENGIGTFQVLASVKKKRVILNRRSFVLVREIPQVTEIASRSNHSSEIHEHTDLTAELASSLGAAIANLHNKGFVHGDLKTRHVLLRKSDLPEIFFVDLEKCWSIRALPKLFQDVVCSRDLIQFFTSMPERSFYRNHVRQEVLTAYWKSRNLSHSRKQRIIGYLRMYGPDGGFRQGKTLLENVLESFNSKNGHP